MMLHWVECHCARCWTSAASTLETPVVTLPSPISENWSGWYWAAFPRYAVFCIFNVGQIQHSCLFFYIFILTADYYLLCQSTVGLLNYTTDNVAHADRTWCQDEWLSGGMILLCFVFFLRVLSWFFLSLLFVFLSLFYFHSHHFLFFLSWMVCWLIESLFRSGVKRFGRGWGAKVCLQVR